MLRELKIFDARRMQSEVRHGSGLAVGTGAGRIVVVAVGPVTVVVCTYVSVATEVTVTGSLGTRSFRRCWAPAKRPIKTEESMSSMRDNRSKNAVRTETGSCMD